MDRLRVERCSILEQINAVLAPPLINITLGAAMHTMRHRCRCGELAAYAVEPGTGFVRDQNTGSYSLRLSATEIVADVFCPFCGGLESGPWTSNPPLCTCGALERWAADVNVPVEWGTIGKDMFGLRCAGGTYGGLAIWFCPACGQRARDVLALSGDN